MILDDCIEYEIDGQPYGVSIIAYKMSQPASRDEPEDPAWVTFQLVGCFGQDVNIELTKAQEKEIERLCIDYLENESG